MDLINFFLTLCWLFGKVCKERIMTFFFVQGVEEIGWRSKGPSPYPIQQNSPARLKRVVNSFNIKLEAVAASLVSSYSSIVSIHGHINNCLGRNVVGTSQERSASDCKA